MRKIKFNLAFLISILLTGILHAQSPAVNALYPSTSISANLQAMDMDANWNAYQAGTVGTNLEVVKYAANGALLRNIILAPAGYSNLNVSDIEVAADKYLYISASGTISGSTKLILIKLNPISGYYSIIATENDAFGNIGFINNRRNILSFSNGLYWVINKNTTAGSRIFVRKMDFNGVNLFAPLQINTGASSGHMETLQDMLISGNNLYIMGERQENSGSIVRMIAAKISSTGTLAFTPLVYSYSTNNFTNIRKFTTDHNGHFFFTGGSKKTMSSTMSDLNEILLLIKMDETASGFSAPSWIRTFDRPVPSPFNSGNARYQDAGSEIYLSNFGDLFIGGSSRLVCGTLPAGPPATFNDYVFVLKYTTTGVSKGRDDILFTTPTQTMSSANWGSNGGHFPLNIKLRESNTGNIYAIHDVDILNNMSNKSKIMIEKYANATGTMIAPPTLSLTYDSSSRHDYWLDFFVEDDCNIYGGGNSSSLSVNKFAYFTFGCGSTASNCSVIADFVVDWKNKLQLQISPFETLGKGTQTISYSLNMGDGTIYNFNSTPNTNLWKQHTYAAPGDYNICLTVYSQNGATTCQDTKCTTITISCYNGDENTSATRFVRRLEQMLSMPNITSRSAHTSTGHVLIPAGTTSGGNDFYLAKIKDDGRMEWSFRYGTTDNDIAMTVAETFDGKYVVAGTKSGSNGAGKIFVLQLNTDGSINFQQEFDNSFDIENMAIVQLEDANHTLAIACGQYNGLGILLINQSLSPVTGGIKTFTNLNGNVQVNDILNSKNTSGIFDGFVVLSRMGISAPYQTLLTKFDILGNTVFSKTYNVNPSSSAFTSHLLDAPSSTEGTAIEQKSNGNYIIVGNMRQWGELHVESKFNTAFSLETDNNGNLITNSAREIYVNNYALNLYDFKDAGNGSYALAGSIIVEDQTGSYNDYKGYLIKTDLDQTINNSGYYTINSLGNVLNNIFVLSGGDLISNGTMYDKIQIVRTDNNLQNPCYEPMPGTYIKPVAVIANTFTLNTPNSGTNANPSVNRSAMCEITVTDVCQKSGCIYSGPTNFTPQINLRCNATTGAEELDGLTFPNNIGLHFPITVYWPDGTKETMTNGDYAPINDNHTNPGYNRICYTVSDANNCTYTSCISFTLRIPETELIPLSFCELYNTYFQEIPVCAGAGSAIMTDPNGNPYSLSMNTTNIYGFSASGDYVLKCYGPNGCLYKTTTYRVTKTAATILGLALIPETVACGTQVDLNTHPYANGSWMPICCNGSPINNCSSRWTDMSGNTVNPQQTISQTTSFTFECIDYLNCQKTTMTVTFLIEPCIKDTTIFIPCDESGSGVVSLNVFSMFNIPMSLQSIVSVKESLPGSIPVFPTMSNPNFIFQAVKDYTIEISYPNGCHCTINVHVRCIQFDQAPPIDNGNPKASLTTTITVFPNPTSSLLNVLITGEISQSGYVFEVYDITGKSIQSFASNKTITQQTIDISAYPSGIYYLKVVYGNNTKTVKIIKN